MTWHSILYNALRVFGLVYALWKGGAPERSCVLLWLLNNALSDVALLRSAAMFRAPETGVLVVDAATLAAFGWIALRANRHWPVFAAGMQAGGVAVHLSRLMQPGMLPFGYALGQAIWAYPITGAIIVGTYRHRARLRTFGADPSWRGS